MNVLVTGATGFLGSRITEDLCHDTSITKVVAAGRKLSSVHLLEHAKLKYHLGDLSDLEYVKSVFKNEFDLVVNCASLSSPWGSYEEFYQANVRSQQNLVEISEKAGIYRYIYISTPGIYYNFKDRWEVKENDPLPKKPVNHYAATKLAAEQILESSRLKYITLRPRALIGRGDTVIFPRLIRSYHEGRLKVVGAGDNIVDLTSVSNVVHSVKLAMHTGEQNCGEAYNICNGEPVKLWLAIEYTLSKFGFPPPAEKIPYSAAYAAAYLMEMKAFLFGGKEPVFTRYSMGVLAKSMTMDITKAKNRLGYSPGQNTWEAIDEFAEWYKSLKA